MKVGLAGHLNAGKTTLMGALSTSGRGNITTVTVPDERFDAICKIVQPKKQTPATIEVVDGVAEMDPTGKAAKGFAENARKMDVLVHVVREFDSPTVPFHAPPNPVRDHHAFSAELVLADLQIIENRIERLSKLPSARSSGSADFFEKSLLERIRTKLEEGTPLRNLELSESEHNALIHYQFLSIKPLIVVVNCSEHNIFMQSELEKQLAESGEPVFRLCALLEAELNQLTPEDRKVFLDEMKIDKPAIEAFVREVYSALGLITFFTAGEKETRAWALKRGANALKAADTIHSDIARGFIRAEVIACEDFIRYGGHKACQAHHVMRLEGKDYIVQDGDVLNIRNKS